MRGKGIHGFARGRRITVLSMLVVAFAIAGCDTDGTGAGTRSGEPIDLCALLEDEEAVAIIGDNDGGKPLEGDPSICQWENPTTHFAISIGVGDPGGAPAGELPPPGDGITAEDGPDGIRWVGNGGGLAEFAAADRVFSVQVYIDRKPAAKRAAQVSVIGLIRPRIPR